MLKSHVEKRHRDEYDEASDEEQYKRVKANNTDNYDQLRNERRHGWSRNEWQPIDQHDGNKYNQGRHSNKTWHREGGEDNNNNNHNHNNNRDLEKEERRPRRNTQFTSRLNNEWNKESDASDASDRGPDGQSSEDLPRRDLQQYARRRGQHHMHSSEQHRNHTHDTHHHSKKPWHSSYSDRDERADCDSHGRDSREGRGGDWEGREGRERDSHGRDARHYDTRFNDNLPPNTSSRYNNHPDTTYSMNDSKLDTNTTQRDYYPSSTPLPPTETLTVHHNGTTIMNKDIDVEPVLTAAEFKLQLVIDIDHTLVHSTTGKREG